MISENTREYINNHYAWRVKRLFDEIGLYDFIVYNSDKQKISKLLTIKKLENFWQNVRKFTNKIYSDFSIGRWQCLAEAREMQLEIQQNCYFDETTNEIKVLEA